MLLQDFTGFLISDRPSRKLRMPIPDLFVTQTIGEKDPTLHEDRLERAAGFAQHEADGALLIGELSSSRNAELR